MTELIIPAGVKADYRPYRVATTPALLYELQQRGVVAELGGQILMPNELISDEVREGVRQQQILQMAQQMGQVIAGSEFCLVQTHQQPNVVNPEAPADELLTMKVLLCRHPGREVIKDTALHTEIAAAVFDEPT